MIIKEGASIQGLHIKMRPVLRASESIWKAHGRPEGVTITAGLDGTHSAASWHYYGCALDLRTRYFDEDEKLAVYKALKMTLPRHDIVVHDTHIHAEISNELANEMGYL